MTALARLSAPLAGLALLCSSALAQGNFELGKMWTFENPPLDYLEREYGFQPSAEWLQKVMLASLRFGNGCSASFVSPHGLILTNHHCVRGTVAKNQGDNDWVRDGFVARSAADEVRLEGLTVQQLVRTTDVTAAMLNGVGEDDSESAIEARIHANEASILERALRDQPELEPQIVKLFQGAIYRLYQYRIFDDVRLVMAPHLQASHFGGDPDNFCYPRFAMDFSFCRAYQDGKPADTSASWFRWSNGVEDGQLVFLTGNPGGTERLLTMAQLEYRRDARSPRMREMIDNRMAIMRAIAARSEADEKSQRTDILALENAQKLYRGEHGALLDPRFMARKARAEAQFKAKVLADPQLAQKYGDLWDRIADVADLRKQFEARNAFQTTGGSLHLNRAVELVRAAADGTVSDQEAEAVRGIPTEMDERQAAFFVDHLQRAQRWLPRGDDWLQAVLGDRTPEQAAQAIAGSRIGEDEFLDSLLADGAAEIERTDDIAVRIARAIAPLIDRNKAINAELDARENVLGANIARAVFDVYGNEVSPDATFTLRFSDGRVKGYPFNGTIAPYRTVFYGLYARNAEFGNEHPFDLPAVWLQRRDRLDLRAAVNFVCTVDSTGGNSGSPVIDKDRNLVGLLFDGNIESMANQYLYGETAERSVCVHPEGIMEALRKIYDAERVADELTAGAHAPATGR
jgi:hypothetical protein